MRQRRRRRLPFNHRCRPPSRVNRTSSSVVFVCLFCCCCCCCCCWTRTRGRR
jgi:hypothetical protein